MNIYLQNESDFSNNGLGFLTDVLSASVTEELNGDYYLSINYKLNGALSEYLVEENIIKCQVEDGSKQLFRIKRVIKDYTLIQVYAQHIFYDLLNNMILDTAPTNLDAQTFGNWILARTNFANSFTFYSDIAGVKSARYVRRNPIEAIMGNLENSMINIFGGDIERDNYTIKLLAQRGSSNGIKLIFGKNIKEIKITSDYSSIITRLLPLGFDALMLPEVYVDSVYINNYLTPKIAKVNFSNIQYDPNSTQSDVYTNIEDAYAALRSAANEYLKLVELPQINVKIDWVELAKTEQYKDYQSIETLHLGDYVTTEILGLDYQTRVTKTNYNVLTDSIDTFEIGSIQRNITTSINANAEKVESINVTSILQNAKDTATAQINSAMGGYIVKTQTDLYIMDTPDTSTAQKVWRWNLNGLGYSSTGINGTYQTAMTADGKIVADMITTGTMSADRIQGLEGVMITVGELGDYIRIDENGNMIFGNPSNEYQLQIENDRVGIYYNGSLISSWIQDQFTVTQLNLGNFAFIPRSNGSLGFRKVK